MPPAFSETELENPSAALRVQRFPFRCAATAVFDLPYSQFNCEFRQEFIPPQIPRISVDRRSIPGNLAPKEIKRANAEIAHKIERRISQEEVTVKTFLA
ncbi:MAG TPA: hypothetical protein VIH72_08360 [Candidatus Acidoferrales bacterium]